MLVVSGDDAAADPGVRALAEQAERVIVVTMFHELAGGWADLILPATGALERDGTTMNLEGRLQRLRRAVMPPCPDELAWISMLAARFDVEISPHVSLVFAELSEHLFQDLSLDDIGLHAAAPVEDAVRRRRPRRPSPCRRWCRGAHFVGELQPAPLPPAPLRPRRRARARARVPAPGARGRASAADAEHRGISSGDTVLLRSNGTSVELRARVNRRLIEGLVRVAEEHAGDLHATIEVAKVVNVEWYVSVIQAFIVINLVHGYVRLPDPRRTQGDGSHAASLRAEPRGPVGPPATDRGLA